MTATNKPFKKSGVALSLALGAAAVATLGLSNSYAAQDTAAAEKLAFATIIDGGDTQEGGFVTAFAYSERTDDATFESMLVTQGLARVTGNIWPRKRSSWAGVALQANAEKPADLSSYHNIHLRLASSTSSTLRLRVMGEDKTIINAGCYPVFVQAVTTDVQEYTIPLEQFKPEGYCGRNARSIGNTLPAVLMIEVTDTTISGNQEHKVDYQVGDITFSK